MPPDAPLRELAEASLELARLRRIRGASHRTWRRIARTRKRLAVAAALLAAAPFAEPARAADPHFRHGFIFHGNPGAVAVMGPAFADLDGDGDLDLFMGEPTGNLFFHENTGAAGQPEFAAPVWNPFGLADVGSYSVPNFADIDGDGDLDALVGASGNQTRFFENTGTATAPAFAAPLTNAFGLAALFLEVADVDGDGDVDAFSANAAGPRFHQNTGTATAPAFAAPIANPFGLTGSGDVSFADVDGDGDLDAFVARFDYSYTMLYFENSGSAVAPAFSAAVSNPFGLTPWSLGFADFADVDGDGDLDALLTGWGVTHGRIAPFENTGTAGAPAFTTLGNPFGFGAPLSYYAQSTTAFGDIDGDGDLDAFVSESHIRTLSFFQNTGGASAPAFAPPAPPFGTLGEEPALVDIDADGDLDLFSGSGGLTLFFLNTGTALSPGFSAPVINPFGLTGVSDYASPAFADIDGDGDLDAFIGEEFGNVVFFRNTGSANAPAFSAPSTNPFGLADVGYWASPTFADADGDGDLDAFIGNSGGDTRFFRNTGSAAAPAFAAPVTNPFGLLGLAFDSSPALADIDADGDLDAFIGTSEERVHFFENVAIDEDACRDGLDNDGDGRIDFGDDPGCASAADTSELGTTQCDNGVDDDGDGLVDSADPHCTGPLDDREAPTQASPGCGLGPELALLVPLLAAVRRRRGSYTARKCPSASPTPRPTSSSSGAP